MVRFLQQFGEGSGDYTAERWQWLPAGMGVAELVAMMRQETAEQEPPNLSTVGGTGSALENSPPPG